MRNTDSPFDSHRFLYREDSGAYPEAPSHNAKLVRFASSNSISSENAGALSKPRNFPLIAFLIAAVLLVVAILLHLSHQLCIDLFYHLQHVISLPSPSDVDAPVTPALKKAIEEIVMEQIKAHTLASRGQRDYALKAAGGRVVPELTTGCTSLFTWDCDAPSTAIDDDVRIGKCWDIPSLPAQLAVVLSQVILPSHVTVEHVPKSIAPDISTAPRSLTLWGIFDGKSEVVRYEELLRADPDFEAVANQRPHITKGHLYAPLLSLNYDIDGDESMQTFAISERFHTANVSFAVFLLEIRDNWGGAATCFYRLRIHGTPI